jgi:DNA invertase Pin-like site-specific DNA recombinase
MLRAVIYCRVSTKEQTKNLSLPVQEKACRDYCEREGYEVAGIFVDEGESAKTIDRPRFKELLAFCRNRKNRVGVVVVNSISRFSRDKYDHAIVRTLLSKLSVTLRSATEPIDDTPTGKMLEGFLSTIAQFENDEKSVRTKKGMKEALERGTWPFPTTLGYLKIPQEDGRSKVVQDPLVAPLIKQAFELFATGRYQRVEVLRIVTAAGLVSKKGRKLSAQSFHNLLRNPFYAGKLVVGRWQIDCKGAFEPIVSKETFRLVELIFAGKRPSSNVRQRSHPDFPLRHFVLCGSCERPLTGSWSTGRRERYAYYHCANGPCKSRNIPKRLLESEFLKLIEQLQPKPEYLNLFREIVLDVWKQRQGEAIKLVAKLESRVNALKAKRQRVIDAFLHERLIDKSTYQEQLDLVNEDVALVEIEIYETKLEELDIEAALNFATSALSNAAMFWTQCSADQKQRFQRVLFPDGLIFDGESYRTATTCLAFSYLRGISGTDSSLASRTGVEPVSLP